MFLKVLEKSPEQQVSAIREAAIRFLARREHSQSELLRKLSQKGFCEKLIYDVLDNLQKQDYQSQNRFTQMWIKGRVARLYGLKKIRNELGQHNIQSDDVSRALEGLDIDWFELCRQAFLKKFAGEKATDWQQIQKQKRYLWQRGFTEEQISYALSAENQ